MTHSFKSTWDISEKGIYFKPATLKSVNRNGFIVFEAVEQPIEDADFQIIKPLQLPNSEPINTDKI